MLDLSLRPALDPVHDTQATFHVLLQALARPGTVLRLPVRAEGAPISDNLRHAVAAVPSVSLLE